MKFDLLKVGVFLIGISLLIISSIIVLVYFKTLRYESIRSFTTATCDYENNVIIIYAREDIKDVKIIDINNNTYCAFGYIKRQNNEICKINVSKSTIYLLIYDNNKKVVKCYKPKYIKPPPPTISD